MIEITPAGNDDRQDMSINKHKTRIRYSRNLIWIKFSIYTNCSPREDRQYVTCLLPAAEDADPVDVVNRVGLGEPKKQTLPR